MITCAKMSYSGCEQLLSIGKHLQESELSPQEIDLVRQHRMVNYLYRLNAPEEDESSVEAALEKCKQVDKLKTLRSDILQSISTMLAQQRRRGATGFTPWWLRQPPGEQPEALPPRLCQCRWQ